MDSQTGQDHHWNRVGHVLTNGPGSVLVRDGTRSQSVVAHDLTLWGGDDEHTAGTTGLAAQSAARLSHSSSVDSPQANELTW